MLFYKSYLFLLVFCLPFTVKAQFYARGEITYQRTYNLKLALQLEERYKNFKEYAKNLPDDIKAYYTLHFNGQKSDYYFLQDSVKEDASENRLINFLPIKRVAFQNQVWTDFKQHTQKALKKIFETNFLITDSLPEYQWKIEDDIRTIAGYPCRKAITTIDDSVVVVAFYTDQIMVSGGPESFNGLPGMILGLAVPRLYTTWFATKVSIVEPDFKSPDIPKKTEKVDRKDYLKGLKKATSSWWGNTDYLIWMSVL